VSRYFTRTNSEYLERDAAPVVVAPLTIAFWGYITSDNDFGGVWIGDKDVANNYWILWYRGSAGGNPISLTARDAGGSTDCNSTAGMTQDVWHHLCGVAAAANDRTVYLNGGNIGTNNVARTPAGADRVAIGRFADSSPGNYWDGRIAEAVILRIAATVQQVQLHAQGVPAPIVWPGWAIAAYHPLFETDRDFPHARYNLIPFNTPSWAPHPPKVLAWWRKYMRGGTA